MHVRPDFSGAVADTSAVIVAVRDDQLGGPTPSPDYTVGDLVEHVDGLSAGLQLTARKSPPPPGSEEPRDGDADKLVDGWRERIPRQLDQLARAWDDPAAWEGDTAAGGVPLPAAAAGMFALDEVIVHGWELARSTGQGFSTDDGAVTACADFLIDQPRDGALFGPVVAVPEGAPIIDRLIGLSGRDPAWQPPTASRRAAAGIEDSSLREPRSPSE